MTRPRHRASTARHTHNWLLSTVAAGLAVLVMSTLSPLGTTAAWSDFAPLREDASIGAGQPILNIAGLEGAEEGLEHQYTSDALTKTADHVRLENVGNVALTRFDATRELSGDSTLPLHSETYFEWTFTRNGGATPPTDWSGWLSELAGLTLQPGEVAEYTVTTALRDVSSLNRFPNSNAVTTLYVGARAANYGAHTATNWSITTGIGFSQSTGHPPPQVELPANAGWFLGDANEGAPYHTLHFVVTAFPTSFNMGSLVEIYAVNNPSEKLLGGWQSFAYHPYFHIAGGDLLSVVPNPGPQVIWIEARANGAVIARAPCGSFARAARSQCGETSIRRSLSAQSHSPLRRRRRHQRSPRSSHPSRSRSTSPRRCQPPSRNSHPSRRERPRNPRPNPRSPHRNPSSLSKRRPTKRLWPSRSMR
ncbi:hypothetical protein [Gryllotalpicola koreensis]|uniref:Uncharacterized protein n=1 Tax=Gryllotalpicola koreensis TaxID=993086 RepID=A0ABP7ZQC4_9MICO